MSARGTHPGTSPPAWEIAFQDLRNVRDLGGHTTRDGRMIRHGWWFRGASLHRVTGADVDALRALGIRTAIDLRTIAELEEHGAFPTAATGIEVRHCPLIAQNWARRDDIDGEDAAISYLVERFVEMLASGGDAVADTVRTLADPRGGPVITYCTAGKDRTGVLTAIVMDLVGVADDDIADEFHRSDAVARGMFHWSDAADQGDMSVSRQAPAVAAAPPGAILGFLAEGRRQYGSMTAYVERYGVDEATIKRLREALLMPV